MIFKIRIIIVVTSLRVEAFHYHIQFMTEISYPCDYYINQTAIHLHQHSHNDSYFSEVIKGVEIKYEKIKY
jgi:hypothetical protein